MASKFKPQTNSTVQNFQAFELLSKKRLPDFQLPESLKKWIGRI